MLRCYSVPEGKKEDVKIVASPPTGTVTFLFTDIEGSTKRWENDPEAMQAALARHDEILRGAIEERGGCVFKTVGDAFCCAFSTASQERTRILRLSRLIRVYGSGTPTELAASNTLGPDPCPLFNRAPA